MKCTDGALVNEAAMKMSQGERRDSEYNFAVAYGEGVQNKKRNVVKRKNMPV